MNKSAGRFLEKDVVSRIAWLYFIKGFTQREISHRLNISRMQVQRSISKSKKEGLVRIQIVDPLTSCFEIEDRLKSGFALADAMVVPTPEDESKIKEALGKAAARYLLRHGKDHQVIGVGWGTTLERMTQFINGSKRSSSQVVSLIGGWTKRAKESPHEIACKLADALHTPCYYISAPAIADSPASHSVITSEKSVNYTLNLAKTSDLAILGIGNADTDSSLVKAGFLSSQEVTKLRTKGAVGDICAQFYDREGHPVDWKYMDRVIGLGLKDLKQIKTVIGVAGGANKKKAILGALRGRHLDVLITDEQTARAVLFE
ncbi:MAG: sugar-binding transcriptional regulator [Desulfobacterales bacterium]|nr:MAG: sugar-binding transcriptional regulator [Desulfobacterales bacterium]